MVRKVMGHLLAAALCIAAIGCATPENASLTPLPPSSQVQMPESSSAQDPLEAQAWEYFQTLRENKEALLPLVQEQIASYKNGTPYPDDFPPAETLPEITSAADFTIRYTGNPDDLGSFYLAVPIGEGCELHIIPAPYLDNENQQHWGSCGTSFERVDDLTWVVQDISLYEGALGAADLCH